MLSAYALIDEGTDGIAICEKCGTHTLLKLGMAAHRVKHEVEETGFVTSKQVIEFAGICRSCQHGGTRTAVAGCRREG